jgi:AraC-like DNA-binding protein
MRGQFEPATAIGAPHSATPYQPATLPPVQDCVAIEVGRLLDDVRRTLESDLGAATRTAARLAAFLASKCSDRALRYPARGGLAPWQKRKIEQAIEDGLENALPVESLARLVSLSSSYFRRAFKESFGEPPHAYIIKRRVERARTLMLTTSESLSQIALVCGLVDQAHFCRCFRQVTGMTPGAWRRSVADDAQSVLATKQSANRSTIFLIRNKRILGKLTDART